MSADRLQQLQSILDEIDALDDGRRHLPYFPFYPQDYLFATRFWTKEEKCCYHELLCHQWLAGKLPAELEQIAALVSVKPEKFGKLWEKRLGAKFICDPSREAHFNYRIEVERLKSLKRGRPKPKDEKPKPNDGLSAAQRAELETLDSSDSSQEPF